MKIQEHTVKEKDKFMKKTTILTSLFSCKPFIEGFMHDITRQTAFEDCELFLLYCDFNDDPEIDGIVQEFKNKYNNIRYEKGEQFRGIGIYESWNYMIQNSESTYITNANVDDRLFSTCIEEHVSVLEEDETIDLAYCYNVVSQIPNESEEDLIKCMESGNTVYLWPCYDFSFKSLLNTNSPHNHPVWRRSLHSDFGYFSTDYKSASDWEFWLRCASGGSKMKMINKVLGIYYMNPQGMSTKKENMDRNIEEVRKIQSEYMGKLFTQEYSIRFN